MSAEADLADGLRAMVVKRDCLVLLREVGVDGVVIDSGGAVLGDESTWALLDGRRFSTTVASCWDEGEL